LRPPSGNVRDNRGIGVASGGIGDIPKNCSGYYTIGLLGVQLELGAAASPFEDRDLPAGNREQLFGIGALQRAGIGAHRGVYPDLPRTSSCSPAESRAR